MCSVKDIAERIKHNKFVLHILYNRLSLGDYFKDDEFVEPPEDLSGYEGYTEKDFDINYYYDYHNDISFLK